MGWRDLVMVFLLYPSLLAAHWAFGWQQDRGGGILCCAHKGGKWKGPWSFLQTDDVWEPLLFPVTSLVARDHGSVWPSWLGRDLMCWVLTSAGAFLGLSGNIRGWWLVKNKSKIKQKNKHPPPSNCPQLPVEKPQTFLL